MRKLLPAILATLVIGIGGAIAQTTSPSGPMNRPTATPQGAAPGQSGTILSERDIRMKLQADGYANVSDLKREGNKYSAMAMKDGRKVSLSVDARTGAVQPNALQ
jgi:hypothetical protein